jgi:antimicrobial peptide system SdpA family protein
MSLAGVALAVCALVAVYTAMSASSPELAVTVPGQRVVSPYLREMAPQGWAFFTKDAQSEYVVPYRSEDDQRFVDLGYGSGSNPRWAFGWNRQGRAQGVEIAALLADIPKERWTTCAASDSCESRSSAAPVSVRNPMSRPTLCKRLQLRAFKPVPWAWRSLTTEPDLVEMISLDVRCS